MPGGTKLFGLAWEEGPWPLPPDHFDQSANLADLREKDTGVPGVVGLSTKEGQLAPHVKWYPSQPAEEAPFVTVTLEQPPRPTNHGVRPSEARAGAAATAARADLNRDALPRFRRYGAYGDRDEVNAFFDGLRKIR